jgi:hypothetical protein
MPIIIPDDLPYTPRGIECLRLGARRGGQGIGCCAIDVIQGFNNDPDAVCPPMPQFNGDSWTPEGVAVGNCTNEEAFLAYLAHGSFSPHETYPDHGFIVTLTGDQVKSVAGKKWLTILKREGFEWVGCVSNSVYTEYHPNHVFMLLRNTHTYMEDEEIERLKSPPEFWQTLPTPSETPEERFEGHAQRASRAHIEWDYEAGVPA